MKLLAVIVFSLMAVSVILAETHIVNQNDGPIYTINDGVAAASNGDTVLVMPGVYLESITLNVELILLGYDPNTTMIYSGATAITCESGSGQSIIKGFKIWGGNRGINIWNNTDVSPIIEWNDIHNAVDGIYSDQRICTIRNNIVRNCSNGIRLYADPADANIYNNVIMNCSNVGIFLQRYYIGNTSIPDPIVYSNILIQNVLGIHSDGVTNGTFSYNDVWNNTTNWQNVTPGPENISADPLFADTTTANYHLQAGSPCIDTGQPGASYLDPDSTRNDMGIFGGPNCWGGGGPGVTDIEITPSSVPQGETIDIEASGTVQ